MPPKFFITHSWKDIEFAKRLCNDLSAHGLDGFFDAYSINPGDDIAGRIARGLEECDVYVPLLSPNAVASKWCELEIHTAINLSMEPDRNERPRIVPVVIKPCNLPTLLKTRLYINFDGRYDDAFQELLTKGFAVAIKPSAITKPVASAPANVVSRDALGLDDITIRAQPLPDFIAPQLPRDRALPRTIINPKDGKEMILIPAGEFLMGSNEGDDEKPPHTVYLDAFYIARHPVTNAEYKKFVDETKCTLPRHWVNGWIPHSKENHPVVNVTWDDAVAYCTWVGGQLSTEAEWEKAASWDDVKKEKRRYPWGNDFDVSKCNSRESNIGDTTPVDKYSPLGDSAYGVGDMAGNVWEWCADWYDANYYKNSPARNPMGPDSGQYRVVRGGSWFNNQNFARGVSRLACTPAGWNFNIGFRFVVASSRKS